MKTKKTFLEGIRIIEQLLHDVIFMCESRLKQTYFTREGNNKAWKEPHPQNEPQGEQAPHEPEEMFYNSNGY